MHGIIGLLMPLFMTVMMMRFFGAESKRWSEGTSNRSPSRCSPGVASCCPMWLAGLFLGPEFPSLIGAMVGLIIVVPAARDGFLLPSRTWDSAERRQLARGIGGRAGHDT